MNERIFIFSTALFTLKKVKFTVREKKKREKLIKLLSSLKWMKCIKKIFFFLPRERNFRKTAQFFRVFVGCFHARVNDKQNVYSCSNLLPNWVHLKFLFCLCFECGACEREEKAMQQAAVENLSFLNWDIFRAAQKMMLKKFQNYFNT